MKPTVVAKISAGHLHSLLICKTDEIADYHNKDEGDLTLDDVLEFLGSKEGQVFLVREW